MPKLLELMYLFVFCGFVPMGALRTARKLDRAATHSSARPAGTWYFAYTVLLQVIFLVLALVVARKEWIELFPSPKGLLFPLAVGGLVLAIAICLIPMRWHRLSPEQRRRLASICPTSARHLWWWSAVSLLAGVSEEITYRGVLHQLLVRLLRSWWPATLVCIVAFALGHAVQGRRSVAAIGVFALVFHLLVLLAGNLYVAMPVHVLYDFAAGVALVRLERSARTNSSSAASRC
jgi:membrane protease YdiL (CAAX protease family)